MVHGVDFVAGSHLLVWECMVIFDRSHYDKKLCVWKVWALLAFLLKVYYVKLRQVYMRVIETAYARGIDQCQDDTCVTPAVDTSCARVFNYFPLLPQCWLLSHLQV